MGRPLRVWLAAEDAGDVVGPHHVGEPVGAQSIRSPWLELDRVHVDLDLGVDAERTGDDRPLRVDLGLLGRELAAAHHLLDQAVVVGDLA